MNCMVETAEGGTLLQKGAGRTLVASLTPVQCMRAYLHDIVGGVIIKPEHISDNLKVLDTV